MPDSKEELHIKKRIAILEKKEAALKRIESINLTSAIILSIGAAFVAFSLPWIGWTIITLTWLSPVSTIPFIQDWWEKIIDESRRDIG